MEHPTHDRQQFLCTNGRHPALWREAHQQARQGQSATARGVDDQLLIDANGEMPFGGSYRKKIPGIDPAVLHFLNRVFAVDARHVYAMTGTEPLLIEDIEPGEVQPAGL